MNKDLQSKLTSKKEQLQKKLRIAASVNSGIVFHWLDYYKEMLQLNIPVKIVYLHQATADEVTDYKECIEKLGDPLLSAEHIHLTTQPLLDIVFEQFPSTSYFKYEIDAPPVEQLSEDIGLTLLNAAGQLAVAPDKVYFLSNDFFPVVELNWHDLTAHGHQLFNDGGRTTLIFTDPNQKWIIFRSIEEEWRCGFWRKNYG